MQVDIQARIDDQQQVVDKCVAYGASSIEPYARVPLNMLIALRDAATPAPNPVVNGQWAPPIGEPISDAVWAALPLNEWIEVLDTKLSKVSALLPPGFVDLGSGKLSAIFHAWCGAAIDQATGRMWFSGGGHMDSSNNGVYEFQLERMLWRIAMQPSIYTLADWQASQELWRAEGLLADTFTNGYYPRTDWWLDGKPTAIHTYRGVEFNPDSGKVMKLGRYSFGFEIDPVDGSFTRGPEYRPGSESAILYDRGTRKYFMFGSDAALNLYGTYRTFHWESGVFSGPLGVKNVRTHGSAPFQDGRLFRWPGGPGAAGYALDADTGQTITQPVATGAKLTGFLRAIAWSQRLRKWFQPSSDLRAMSVWDAATNAWSHFPLAGAPPSTSTATNGPYTKFRMYERSTGVYAIWRNNAGENLRIVRVA